MTRFVKANCPQCGARLKIDEDAEQMRCDYCGAVARIESEKNPVPPAQYEGMVVQPVVRISTGARYVWIFVLIPILISMGIGATAFFRLAVDATSLISGAGVGSGGGVGQSFGEHMQWVGHKQAMLFDVNQDGVADPVGWIRFLDGVKTFDHLAAFNAVNGDRLWVTDPIVDGSQQHLVKAAVRDDRLLVADAAGVLRAYSLYNGQLQWNAMLGERVDRICPVGPGVIRVETTDKRALSVALANGQITPAGQADKDAPCVGIVTTDPGEGLYSKTGGGTWDEGGIVNPEIEGMNVAKVLVDKTSGAHVALGRKQPGTGVPTIAAYPPGSVSEENRKVTALWLTAVSTANPLTVEEGDVELGAISAGRVIVPYEMQGAEAADRLACVELASGRNLWDVEIPRTDAGDVGAVVTSDRQVFVSHWTYLDVFDLSTGAHRMTIGKW